MARHLLVLLIVCNVLRLSGATRATETDWNQWRGPNRDGISAQSMDLADKWPEKGPRRLWLNKDIPSNNDGGYGSLSIADGKGYLYLNWKHREPIAQRTLTKEGLATLGWQEEKMPVELRDSVETARLSEERSALKNNEVKAWVDKWIKEHVAEDQKKAFEKIARQRLTLGNRAADWETLIKLESIIDRKFDDQEALDAWHEENAIPKATRNRLISIIPRTFDTGRDAVVCVNLEDGSVIWEKRFAEEEALQYGTSGTPAVVNGKVYATGSKRLYCLAADTGEEIWQADLEEKEVSSSPAVVDGVVVVLAGRLKGFDANTGELLWTIKEINGKNPSPSFWKKDAKTYLLCNGWTMGLVDPATGQALWTVRSGGSGSAAVSGDVAVVLTTNKALGLVAYRFDEAAAELIWSVNLTDRGSTPVIVDGYVYVVGGNKFSCFRLADGHLQWEADYANEIASPVVADGKIFAHVMNGRKLLLVQPNPEKFELLDEATMKISTVVMPVLHDGKLFLREREGLVCYDVSSEKQQ